ncbi:MAG: TetR/AcrR family transcriptional regulator [Arthrospira sp. SH-MAG29]|nr:TetR/AcrR family transcriptional regulator [Arthrospira sp. SH-MAG29]MBS0015131.1 TetR/AcrR family transcriptional regulator [Arthrospira sp. SH-MAG29]
MSKISDQQPQPELTDKGEQILRGAMPEFLTHGYASTSMDRVAKAAGVSKQTLYSHFSDKDGLFTALVKRIASEKLRIVWSPPLSGKPELVLRDLAKRLLMENISDREYLGFIRLIVSESGKRPDLAQIFLTSLVKPAIETLTEYLKTCQELTITDPEATARIFVGSLIHYMVVQEILQGKDSLPMTADRLIDNLVELIIHQKALP